MATQRSSPRKPSDDRDFVAEPGPQIDPFLQTERRASGMRIWLIALAAFLVIALVIYGMNSNDDETASTNSAPAAGSPATVTSPAPTTTGQAPAGGAQKPAAPSEGTAPPNTAPKL
jgi:hypothetical protein